MGEVTAVERDRELQLGELRNIEASLPTTLSRYVLPVDRIQLSCWHHVKNLRLCMVLPYPDLVKWCAAK